MNLTAIILLSVCLTASAKGFNQTITLVEKDAPLEQVLKKIKQKAGYHVVYREEWMVKANKVTVHVRNVSVEDALDACFRNQPLDYTIIDNTIVVTEKAEKPNNLQGSEYPEPPQIDVKGRVVNENGEPVAGASIMIKGTNQGTNTNGDGFFELNNVKENTVIIVSSVNIDPKEIKVNGRSDLYIVVRIKITAQKEIIINAGYYRTTDQARTGNITKVDGGEIERQPVTSLLMGLQGRVPGLEIMPGNGVPGSSADIKIRGNNSLRFDGSYPLYIIDGVPVESRPIRTEGTVGGPLSFDPLSTINPANIESIEILKDGVATAIYGSRGANGVILITTKKGVNSGKTTVDVSVSAGVGELSNKLELLNTTQYLQMRKEAFTNAGNNPGIFDFDINGTSWDTSRYTDWQDELLGGAANILDVQAFITGGNKTTNFRLGGNFHKENVIYSGDFGYTNMTGSFSLNHTSQSQKLKASASVSYGANKNKLFRSSDFVQYAIILPPNAPELYDSDGELNWQIVQPFPNYSLNTWINPLSLLRKTHKAETGSLIANSILNYSLTPDLVLKTSMGFTELNGSENIKSPISSFSPTITQLYGTSTFGTNKRKTTLIEPQADYHKRVGDHTINVTIGGTFQKSNYRYFSMQGSSYMSDALLNSILGAANKSIIADDEGEYKYTSFFGRLGYDWNGKYQTELIGRRDGSSRFGPGKRFGNFGAIGLGWVFSKTRFLEKEMKFLSFGKLRASYGITGNDQIGDYNFYNTYSVSSPYLYQGGVILYPSSLYNPEYSWEVTKKLEAGLKLGFMQDNISLELSWYRNRSSNQLVNYQLPGTTGFQSVLKNFSALIENSGWEAMLVSKNIVKKDWKWVTAINVSIPRNKLVAFDDIENSPYATRYKVGEPLSIQRLFVWKEVDPQTGMHTYQDLNNDGAIISDDDMIFSNAKDKKYYGGINNAIGFKNLELSFLIQFCNTNSDNLLPGMPGMRSLNQPIDVLERWQKPGDISDVQKFHTNTSTYGRAYNRLNQSTYNIQSGSYFRLKTLSLSYRLSNSILNKMKLQDARFYLQGQNLFTITKFKGLDPETGSSSLPPLRMLIMGIAFSL